MKLWVESAYEVWPADTEGVIAGAASTLTTEDQFIAVAVGPPSSVVDRPSSELLAQPALAGLRAGNPMDRVVADVLAALPAGEHVAASLLRIGCDGRASLAEIDAPPLFMARRGDFVLLPGTEEEVGGRLVRRCDFTVQVGDHLALVSEGYIRARGGSRPWSWREVALSIRRLTATGCDAEQLAGALVRLAGSWKLEAGEEQAADGKSANQQTGQSAIRNPQSAIVLALFVRPMRTVTVWSGPPANPRRDHEALARLLAEEGTRIICGDTTAEIAARLLGGKLEMEPPPDEGWTKVPPTSRLVGAAERVNLITEGAVTLRVARERLAEARRSRDLAGRLDGASRLAKALLDADKITIIEGQAVNPAQRTADGATMRRAAVAGLAAELEAQGKIVVVEDM